MAPEGTPITAVDGARYRELLHSALAWLDRHHEIVNSLNVFPVPDGDTGTNMLLTLRSAVQEVTDEQTETVSDVSRAVAQGALMGARGNSGVILSQILRGMARSLDGQVTLTGPRLAAALSEGSRLAYRGVNRPVEGTILTVVREAAAAAENATALDPDLRHILHQTVLAADEAVAKTPSLLPVLAQAGKVDSGGKGLFYILEGLYRGLVSADTLAEPELAGFVAQPAAAPRINKGQRELPAVVYGFDVQFLIEGQNLDVDAIREHITAMGDCPLVEGEPTLVKVHVHVPDPGAPLSYGISLGFITDVVVENMDDMHLPELPAAPEVADATTAPEFGDITGPGIVVVSPGDGLAEVFRSLGAHIIVAGGQTMNPSTKDLLDALERLPTAEVLILPNNGNVIMAAQQARAMASDGKVVAVVPSRSIPQGISALLAFSQHASLERNLQTMTGAMAAVQTGEVTIAVQDARFDGIEVKAGSIIGLLNDQLTTTGPTCEAVVKELLAQMNAASLEVIALYTGEPVTADEAQALLDDLQATYPQQEIEIVRGGQPFYHYIISAE
jgi:DAK2 domain fusion protein YloV